MNAARPKPLVLILGHDEHARRRRIFSQPFAGDDPTVLTLDHPGRAERASARAASRRRRREARASTRRPIRALDRGALDEARGGMSDGARVVICGSLYLGGACAATENGTPPDSLPGGVSASTARPRARERIDRDVAVPRALPSSARPPRAACVGRRVGVDVGRHARRVVEQVRVAERDHQRRDVVPVALHRVAEVAGEPQPVEEDVAAGQQRLFAEEIEDEIEARRG